jgi:hypothetical protein
MWVTGETEDNTGILSGVQQDDTLCEINGMHQRAGDKSNSGGKHMEESP